MNPIQVVLILFALFAWSRVVNGLRRGTLALTPFLLWTVFWVGAIVVVVHPETTMAVAKVFGVGRGVDLVIYLALVMVFFLVFRLFAKIEDLERQLTRFVRAQALKDLGSDPEVTGRR